MHLMHLKRPKYLRPLHLVAFTLAVAPLSPLSPLARAASANIVPSAPSITRTSFGTLPDGRRADLYTLLNGRGMTVRISNLGGIITSIMVPDRKGKLDDVVLGLDTPGDYLTRSPLYGALVGRVAGRISGARFDLDGETFRLAANSGSHHIHGGRVGFDKRLWKARPLRTSSGPALDLTYFSPSGEEGYPGNLNVRVRYTLTSQNELRVDYHAVTDRATLVNLTQHSYFNLKGHGKGDILNHRLTINASKFLPTNADTIPTGEQKSVLNSPFDFLSRLHRGKHIGKHIDANDQQIKLGRGYDHTFVLDRASQKPSGLALAARVEEPQSGRVMSVLTTEPALIFYTGNYLNNGKGKGDATYIRRGGFCLEAQNFPDAVNHAGFPSSVLRPGQTYRQITVFRFSTR